MDSSLSDMANAPDDELVDESFCLYLSEDEDDEKTEMNEEEINASTVSLDASAKTEDDILDKFVMTESTVLKNVDDELENKLLDDAEDDGEANVPTDRAASAAEQQEDESKATSPNSVRDKDSKDNSSVNCKKSSGDSEKREAASDSSENSANAEDNVDEASYDEDSGKKNYAKDDVISMTSDSATSGVIEKSLSAEEAASATAEKTESTEEIKDASDAVVTDISTKSSKRLSDTSTAYEAKKIKLQEGDSAAVPKSMTVEVKDKKSEDVMPDYNVVTSVSKIPGNAVSQYMQRKNLKTLSRNDLERICLSKMCEAICHKKEVEELKHQLNVQLKMGEKWKIEAAQLKKQTQDLKFVNKKLLHKMKLQNKSDQPLTPSTPIMITRSVGLQVRPNSFMMSNVMTPERRTNRPQPSNMANPPKQNRTNINTTTQVVIPPGKRVATVADKLTTPAQAKPKVTPAKSSLLFQALQNSAARAAAATASMTAAASTSSHMFTATPGHMFTATPPTPTTSSTATLVCTSTTQTTLVSSSTKSTSKPAVNPKAFIDLTDEVKEKPATAGMPTPTTQTTTQGLQIVSVPINPGNVVNTVGVINPPEIMYERNNQLHHNVLAADVTKPEAQLGLNSNFTAQAANEAGQMQPVRLSSQVTVVGNTKTTEKTVLKHPASLPPPPASQFSIPVRKPIPPKPHLCVSHSNEGILVSWNMPYNLHNYEAIASYQLYACQETTLPGSLNMWRMLGEVTALVLPMTCTLKQLTAGNKYHFAVRAIDVQKRIGPFSDPEQIIYYKS